MTQGTSWVGPANGGSKVLFYHNEFLFLADLAISEQGTNSHIDIMTAAGEDKKTIISLGGNESFWGAIAGDDENLYLMIDRVEDLEGTPKYSRMLTQYNINSGSRVDVCTLPVDIYMVGAYKESLVFLTMEDANSGTICSMYTVNLATGETNTIGEWKLDENIWRIVETDLVLISKATRDVTTYDLETGDSSIVSNIAHLVSKEDAKEIVPLESYDGHILLSTYDSSMKEHNLIYVDIETSDAGFINLRYTFFADEPPIPISILSETQDSFLIISGNTYEILSLTGPDGLPYEAYLDIPVRSLILKTDFWNSQQNYRIIDDQDTFV